MLFLWTHANMYPYRQFKLCLLYDNRYPDFIIKDVNPHCQNFNFIQENFKFFKLRPYLCADLGSRKNILWSRFSSIFGIGDLTFSFRKLSIQYSEKIKL